MASVLYNSGKDAILDGTIGNITTATLKLTLIDTGDYTFSQTHTDFANDVASAAKIQTETLSNVTVSDGTVDADDVTFSSVTGDEFEALILWDDDGADGVLIAYIDSGTNLPLVPNGGDVVVEFSASGIFSI